MNFLLVNWTAVSAISSAISAVIALTVVLINVKIIKETQNTLHMENVPWFFVQYYTDIGDSAGIILNIQNEGNAIIAVEKVILKVVGTYKTEELKYRYEFENNKEEGRILSIYLPTNPFFLSKEVEVYIYYKNQYGKLMKSTSPSFKMSGHKEKHWHLTTEVKEELYFIPFSNEIT